MKRLLFALALVFGLQGQARADSFCSAGTLFTCGGGITTSGNLAFTGVVTVHDETKFQILDETDNTKKFQWNLDAVTTGNTPEFAISGTAAAPVWVGTGWLIRAAAGASSAPTYSFTGFTNEGLYRDGNGPAIAASGGAQVQRWSGSGAIVGTLFFDLTNADSILTEDGANAATLQMGLDVNGAAVHQTFKAHDGITGTDIAGANFTVAGGRGTGAGAGGNVLIQAAPALGTGTTAQTLADRDLTVGKAKTLTDAGGAESVVQIAVAAGEATGGKLEYTIFASDGTDHQSRSGFIIFTAVNKAGTETCTLGTATDVHAESTAVADMTVAFACSTAAANAITITADTTVSGLVETTLNMTYRVFKNGGSGAITTQ